MFAVLIVYEYCNMIALDKYNEWDKANNCQDIVYKIELAEKNEYTYRFYF